MAFLWPSFNSNLLILEVLPSLTVSVTCVVPSGLVTSSTVTSTFLPLTIEDLWVMLLVWTPSGVFSWKVSLVIYSEKWCTWG